MAITVGEIMNRELLSVGPDDRDEDVSAAILAFGVTAVPVLDLERRPLGVVSLRDLMDPERAGRRASTPAICIRECEPIEEAARRMTRRNVHHLVVVDAQDKAIGMVSTLDVIRGMLGEPATHPASFPHLDGKLGVSWTDDVELSLERLDVAPDGPGILVLVRGGRGVRERAVWAEGCRNVRARLSVILSEPAQHQPALAAVLGGEEVRFRAASLSDPARQESVVRAIFG